MARKKHKKRARKKRSKKAAPKSVRRDKSEESLKKKGARPEEKKLTPLRVRAIFFATFLALGIFSMICIFSPSSAGLVGRGIDEGLSWFLGVGRYAVPFAFMAGAGLSLLVSPELRPGLITVGLLMVAVSALAIIHTPNQTGSMFTENTLTTGGGLLGASLAWPLVKLVGKIGAYIFTICAIVLGMFIAFEEQIVSFARSLREKPLRKTAHSTASNSDYVDESGRLKPEKAKGAGTVKVYPSFPQPPSAAMDDGGGQLAMSVGLPRRGKYKLPPTSILNRSHDKAFSKKSNEERKTAIEKTLHSMDVDAHVVKVSKGPTVSLFEVEVGTGEKVKRVTELEQDIAYALGSPDIRIYSPIPGRQAIGIEVPNHIRDNVILGDIIDGLGPLAPQNLLTVAVGKDMSGEPVVLDLAQLPHLLLAGSTGSGKSCCINSLVSCLLFRCTPEQLKLIMIDPKFVEFTWYEKLPHLLCEVINEPEPASKALLWAVQEMDRRYQQLQKMKVVHIDDYNAIADGNKGVEPLPKIVIVIDELGDLMIVARREVETSINRLTAKARAVGIHLIIATQRPSVDVITGVIKNNITARIAFQVASNADSRTILRSKGAEKLLGKGDMLLDPGNIPQPERVQGALIQQKEIELLTGYIREQKPEGESPIDLENIKTAVKEDFLGHDPFLLDAAEYVVFAGEASASMLQTHLRVGYARARRIIVELAQLGIVGPHEGSKSRKVLLTPEEFEAWKARRAPEC